MPYRKRTTYRRRRPAYTAKKLKKYVKKYKRNYKRIPRGVSTQSNIPRMQKLRYVDDISLTISAGAPAYHQFRANSIFDPDYSGTGHQPMRFDEMAKFYADYVVIGSKITIKHCGGATAVAPVKMALYLNDTSISSLVYVNDLIEQGRVKYRVTSDNGSNHSRLALGFSAKKFFGLANVKDNVDRIGANCSTNPADQAFFIFAVQPMDNAANIGPLRFEVIIEYLVWFNQPLQLSVS